MKVKKSSATTTTRRRGTTKISAKSQITIPAAARRAAGLNVGDSMRVEALKDGELRLVRDVDPLEKYAGCLTGVMDQKFLRKLRDEWDR